MTSSKMIHIRVDDDLRDEATAVFAALGLSMSDAVRLFLHRAVASQSLPLELKVPNAATQAALREARQKREARKSGFETPEALFADLNGPERPDEP